MTHFVVGQIVRLERGWTPLQILEIKDDKIRAKYCGEHHWDIPICDFKEPHYACNTQTRRINERYGFIPWDGSLRNLSFNKAAYSKSLNPEDTTPMATPQFMLKKVRGATNAIIGTFIGRMSNGAMVLEMSDGSLRAEHEDNLKPYYERAMLVKSVSSNYRCNYIVPYGAKLKEGDLIVSDSDNIYRVLKMDVEGPGTNIKGIFQGKKLKATDI